MYLYCFFYYIWSIEIKTRETMTTVEKVLLSNGVKSQSITTPSGTLIMADNKDGTFQQFKIDVDLKEVYSYLGY